MTDKERREKRKQNGLCVICGQPSVAKKTMCQTCAENEADYRKQKRIRRINDGLCTYCGKCPPILNKKRCQKCHNRHITWVNSKRDHIRAYHESYKVRNLELRTQRKKAAMDQYGGKCFCCGETDIRFLTIDHINEDGAEHRRKIAPDFKGTVPGGEHFYRWLAKNDWPFGLQVACYNCNIAKHWNNGICPHQDI